MTPADILDFWFSEPSRRRWFKSTSGFDRELAERFEELHVMAADGVLADWEQSPDGALALVILLDQIPLNIYRGEPRCFATEGLALAVAGRAIARGLDRELAPERLAFLYMPYMHSESLTDQERSVELYTQPGLEHHLKWARHHRDIVRRFGRFPHRNAVLGRESTPEEQRYLDSPEAFKG
jgi:uncharacterized protein (DUF924 family)